ncbi:peptide ABC transporter substrate-binding protein [Clostridium sp. P21]|uniref:Peptide ABC transporter substrate-binding protein n=1 Tax=Clostridium muellerianum TaxID=2716538 RepID=A0A7Y0HN92_9CLOT|nr:peptide ABC transporter substrate-binding protein [Clostridium muellerianum]NMM63779.1 peptide ABC transporter substrate-binding protein [Clostridium muellerianum]
MKSKRLMSFLVTAMIVSTTGFVGCGGSSQQTQGSSEKLDKDQHLVLCLDEEPKTLDPSRSTDTYSGTVITDTQEALTRCLDKNGEESIEAAGAESWKTSEDGLTWTFKLRSNKWSDGKEVKAQDYEYSIKRTLDPNTASEYSYLLYPIKGAKEYNKGQGKVEDVGIKALDDKTLEIKLGSPCAYFIKTTYFKVFTPQRKDIVEKSGEKFGSEGDTLVSSGPFIIKNWVHKNKMELEKNPNYWDKDKVKLDKVTFKIIADVQARMNELYNGSLDLCRVEKKEWFDKFKAKNDLTYVTGPDISTDYNFFYCKDKLFSNMKVRRAFSLALDREDHIKTLYPETRKPFYAWCPPAMKIGDEDFRKKVGEEPLKKIKEEVKDPKALLSEGLKELGMDPDPSKITVTIAEGGTDARAKQVCEHEQANYQKVLGCKVKIDYMDWAIFQDKARKGNYQIAAMNWGADYNDPMTMFDLWTTGSDMNNPKWSNAKYDALIEKASKTMDQKVRFEAFKEAEQILLSESPISPTSYRVKTYYMKKCIKGMQYPMFSTKEEFKYAYIQGRDNK